MSVTTVERSRARLGAAGLRMPARFPLWRPLLLSRLLILVVGVVSALVGPRPFGWRHVDPTSSTLHLGSLGNLLAASVDRWDSIHYIHIAQHGYTRAINTSFYPLYPLLMRLFAPVTGGSYVIAGVAISLVSFVVALALLHRLAVEELDQKAARATILLLVFAPLSFFFTAVYTESLFLALSAGAFYLARHERWGWAAVLVAAATATRVPGILLIPGLLYLWWRSETRPRSAAAWLCLAGTPLLAYSLYLEARGYGLLASIHNEASYGRTLEGPIMTVFHGVQNTVIWIYQAARGGTIPYWIGSPLPPPMFDVVELVVLGITLAALIEAWRRLPRAYAIYCTLAVIVCLSDGYSFEPLKTFDRFALTMFPLWMIVGLWASRRPRLLNLILAVEVLGLVFYTHQFATWMFVA